MSRLGVRKGQDLFSIVTSNTSLPNGGWEEVQRLTWEELKSTNTKWVFLCWGRAGFIHNRVGASTTPILEVALGDDTGFVSANYTALLGDLANTELNRVLEGIPFFFCLPLDGVVRDWGNPLQSEWTAGRDLVLYARVFSAGAVGTTGKFVVADVDWLAFDLDAITAPDWHIHERTNLQNSGLLTEPPATIYNDPSVVGVTGQEWLHFFHLHYYPKHANRPPSIECGFVTDGTEATFVPVVGTDRFGVASRGFASGGTAGPHDPHHYLGCFWPTITTGVGFSPWIRMQDTHAIITQRTKVRLTRVFSVWIEKFAFYRALGQAVYPPPGLPSVGVTAQQNEVNWFRPWEIIVPRGADYTVLNQAIVDHKGNEGQFRAYTPTTTTDDPGSIGRLLRPAILHATARSPFEGVPLLQLIEDLIIGAPGTPSESRYRFHFWAPSGGFNHIERWDIRDALAVGFYLDDDPLNVPNPPEPPPPPVILIPGKEALDTSSLSAVPHAPDVQDETTPEVPIEELKGDTGYKRTWPRFASIRRTFSWAYTGVGPDVRNSLDAFFIANPTFKYTQPGESSPTPYATMSRIEWVDTGLLFSATLEVGELVNVGP